MGSATPDTFPEWILRLIPGFVSRVSCDLEYRWANPRLLAALGLSNAEICGHRMGFREPADAGVSFSAQARSFFASGRDSAAFEAQLTLRDGSANWLLVEARRIPDTDDAIFIGIDITEAKQLREALMRERDERAHETVLASLGELAAGVAHEMRSPLAAIMGNAELLELSAEDPERVRELARKIIGISERINKISTGLQNYARKGDRDPFCEVAVLDVVAQAADLLSAQARQARVHFDVSGIPTHIICDCRPHELLQVLVNLMRNALDAQAHDGSGWVRVTAAQPDPDTVEIAITDAGQGIAPEIAARLLEPFFTTKAPGKGTGLGLKISRRIISEHHGTLSLDSAAANTCFRIRLPRRQKKSPGIAKRAG